MYNLVTTTQKYIKENDMGIERLTVKTSGGDKLTYDNLEAGEYEARLIYVADLGMQNRKPCLLYTSPSPRDGLLSRMPSSA